jgi:hypothetical protein
LISFAAARWELFAFPEVRDLARGHGRHRFVVLYEGDQADPDAWCRRLTGAGLRQSRSDALTTQARRRDGESRPELSLD